MAKENIRLFKLKQKKKCINLLTYRYACNVAKCYKTRYVHEISVRHNIFYFIFNH